MRHSCMRPSSDASLSLDARADRPRTEQGFTLVEILVVITIIAALIAIVSAVIPQAQQANRKTQCANNLRNIGGMLVQRQTSSKGLGPHGGAAMLLYVYTKGMIRKGDEGLFICPGDVIIRGQSMDDPDFKARYDNIDLDNFDPLIISYAGRDRKQYPIRPDSNEKQGFAVDCQGDDGRTGHHKGGVNCLYDDGSVKFLDREALGLTEEEPIVVGIDARSDSELRKYVVQQK